MTMRYLHDYTLAELDKELDHAPVSITLQHTPYRYEIHKAHMVTTAGTPYLLYELVEFHHGEWCSTRGGMNTLDELILEKAFSNATIEPNVVEAGGVLSLPEGEQG